MSDYISQTITVRAWGGGRLSTGLGHGKCLQGHALTCMNMSRSMLQQRPVDLTASV